MTTYTILDTDGSILERGVTLAEAADAIMTSDGCEWAIRMDEPGYYTAWSRQQVANRSWEPTIFTAYNADSEDAACDAICVQIVNHLRLAGHCEAMTDADYDEMMAQVAIDNGEGDED